MEFDEKLFEKCFWHFINYTNIPDDVAVQVLQAILAEREEIPQRAEKLFRPWYLATGIPWKDERHQYAHKDPAKGPATPIQQMNYLVNGIYNCFGTERYIRYHLAKAKKVGRPSPKGGVEARYGCELHAQDNGKIVDVQEYLRSKPMGKDFKCNCTISFQPLSDRMYEKWLARVQSKAQKWDEMYPQ